ncbi:hypothetical protein [Marinospirillum minutulum]|uniref:hypothetical protein n=1 Tax=Marinospirillum minutulum TaxID=64974 RepID=UPI0004183E7F|nr:hypothetical protein [Marinospirillum minutulum]
MCILDTYKKELTDLIGWASREEFNETVKVLIHVLGFFSYGIRRTSLRNITDEILHQESISILKKWQDTVVARELLRFAQSYRHSDLFMSYGSLVPAGDTAQAVKRIKGYTQQTYLLAMILNPLTHSDKHYEKRQKLRLWLIVHSVIRVTRYHYHGDTKLSSLARSLVLGPSSIAEWSFIDFFLLRAERLTLQSSFDDFNYALIQAAEILLHEKSSTYGRKEKIFLNNVIAVANYECHPNDQADLAKTSRLPIISLSLVSEQLVEGLQLLETDDEYTSVDLGFNYLPVLPESLTAEEQVDDESTYEEREPELLVEVDPSKNEAEQLLATRSVFLHTAEEASYLPWSLDQILPPEHTRLQNWVNLSLKSTNLSTALGAALCWLALQTGRSLDGVRRFKINDNKDYEWSLSEDFSHLHKKVIRRRNAWKPNEQSINRVADFTHELSIKLNQKLSAVVSEAASKLSFKAETLHDLWRINLVNIKPEVWLNNALPNDLQRITSSKLASYIGQQVFENTSDHNLARNITAHPNSGLPAACGYGTWDIDAIEQGLEQPLEVASSVSPTTHLLGSLLSPLEALLIDKIKQANALLDKNEFELVEFHNQIAQYTTYALYAATGARYLIDPFQSLEHFNLEQGFVFINDKSDGGIHQGRIVPLPQLAIQILQQYLKHLVMLSAQLKILYSELADCITELVEGNSKVLPLFFLLDQSLYWHSMNKNDLPGVPLFEWGLPKNLFRHRYNQQLYKENVPVEVIDGLMGHAERGAITYGDTSPRCWLNDVAIYSPSIDRVFAALPFKVFDLNSKIVISPAPTFTNEANLALEIRLFGQALRKKKRSDTLRKNIRQARDDIRSALRGRALSDLSVDEVQELINKMLFRGGQLGHPFAATRLEILRKQIHREAPVHKSVIRRRIVQDSNEKNTLSETVAQDYQCIKALEKWSASLPVGRSNYSKTNASLVGVAVLAIEKRIAYPRLLLEILEGNNFRVLKDKQQLFIEYSETLEVDDPFAAVQRHEINQQIGSLITLGSSRKKLPEASNIEAVKSLKSILQLDYETTSANVLKKLAQVIEQANHVDMPGMVAAMLAGRVLSTSLPIQDYLRVKNNQKRVWEVASATNSKELQTDIQSALKGQVETKDTKNLKSNAINFRKAILSELNEYKPSQAKVTAKQVSKICSEFEGKVSNALLLVGFWIAHIVERGRRDRKSKPLAISTITTYWATLITVFERLAYESNLIALDSEEITGLYRDMLDYKTFKSSTTGYFANRLIDFHRWAKDWGVIDPDWSELDFEDEGRLVRSGLLSEKDYQAALTYIRSAYKDKDTRILMSFLLLLTYRFGLRSSEATGLLARDWCEYQDLKWVLIRNNKLRRLKTESSQRAIPLLFKLSNLETKTLQQVFSRYETLAGKSKNNPLFCELEEGGIKSHSHTARFPSAIIEVLRIITGSTNLVLHHARHSFHNRVAAALLEIDTPLTKALNEGLDKTQVQQIVLGRNHQVSRRNSMALARLMGHSAPTTGMRNYNHLLTEWADKLTPVTSKRIEIKDCIDTKSFTRYTPPKAKRTKIKFQPLTFENTFKVLRLVAIGWSFEKAGGELELNPEHINQLVSTFEQANGKMRFNARGSKTKILGSENPNTLLRYITNDAWQRILSIAAKTPSQANNLPKLPAVDQLHNMVSHNGQILIDSEESANLVKLVLDLFLIKQDCYSVSARGNEPAVKSFLEAQSFSVVPVEKASYKATRLTVDQYEIYEGGKKTGLRYEYGVLNLFRNEGVLRCSNDLVVALLGLGVFAETRQVSR